MDGDKHHARDYIGKVVAPNGPPCGRRMPPGARRPKEAATRNGDGGHGEDHGGEAGGEGPPAGVCHGRAANHEQQQQGVGDGHALVQSIRAGTDMAGWRRGQG